jgi:hypothetical protein
MTQPLFDFDLKRVSRTHHITGKAAINFPHAGSTTGGWHFVSYFDRDSGVAKVSLAGNPLSRYRRFHRRMPLGYLVFLHPPRHEAIVVLSKNDGCPNDPEHARLAKLLAALEAFADDWAKSCSESSCDMERRKKTQLRYCSHAKLEAIVLFFSNPECR